MENFITFEFDLLCIWEGNYQNISLKIRTESHREFKILIFFINDQWWIHAFIEIDEKFFVSRYVKKKIPTILDENIEFLPFCELKTIFSDGKYYCVNTNCKVNVCILKDQYKELNK